MTTSYKCTSRIIYGHAVMFQLVLKRDQTFVETGKIPNNLNAEQRAPSFLFLQKINMYSALNIFKLVKFVGC